MTEHKRISCSKRHGFICADCESCTYCLAEYYMVNDFLWGTYGAKGKMLCIGCLEKRIGRTLTGDDFLLCPLNLDIEFTRSKRLINRMSAWAQ